MIDDIIQIFAAIILLRFIYAPLPEAVLKIMLVIFKLLSYAIKGEMVKTHTIRMINDMICNS